MGLRLIALLVASTVLLAGCAPSDSDFNEFSTYKSPDGGHYVIIDAARSKLAFGAETIKVYVVERDNRVRNHIVTTKIANDGGGISEKNVKAEWINPDVILFCLSGAEQQDSRLEVNVRSLSYVQESKECS